jgi:hypothetical protein
MLLSILVQQTGPAETTTYMLLGFGVIFVSIAVHLWSLYGRAGRLKKDLALLEDLEENQE